MHELGRTRIKAGKHKKIKGIKNIDKIIDISQDPIGRTPRSNPATYTGVFDDIRALFAQTPEADVYKRQDDDCGGFISARDSFLTQRSRICP